MQASTPPTCCASSSMPHARDTLSYIPFEYFHHAHPPVARHPACRMHATACQVFLPKYINFISEMSRNTPVAHHPACHTHATACRASLPVQPAALQLSCRLVGVWMRVRLMRGRHALLQVQMKSRNCCFSSLMCLSAHLCKCSLQHCCCLVAGWVCG